MNQSFMTPSRSSGDCGRSAPDATLTVLVSILLNNQRLSDLKTHIDQRLSEHRDCSVRAPSVNQVDGRPPPPSGRTPDPLICLVDLEKILLRKVGEAIHRVRMIEDATAWPSRYPAARIQSLCSKPVLLQKRAPIDFSLCAFHVDRANSSAPSSPSAIYSSLGIEWTYHTDNLPASFDRTAHHGCDLCSRFRRRAVYQIARAMGANVIAFGHTADDLCESLLRKHHVHGPHQLAAAGDLVARTRLPSDSPPHLRHRGN